MSSAAKRLDLRFGAFACSVQGFDDPVPPVQQILRAIQHLLEESPELSDTGINFDAEAIEQLVGEVARRAELSEDQVEIVPGLIIIHHGAGGDLAAGADQRPAAGWAERDEDTAAWAPDEEQGAGGAYVNIFAQGEDREAAETGGEGPESDAEAAPAAAAEEDEAPPGEEFAERLRRMAAGGEADYGWGDDEEGGGAPVWPYEPEEESAEVSGDTGRAAADEPGEPGTVRNLFAAEDASGGEAGGETGAGGADNLFAEPAADEPEDEWQLGPAAEADAEAAPEEAEPEGYTAASLAERAEARTVPEMMVASAAWMVLIQGQTSFKRRDVLDVFETIPGEHEKSLEAQIKGFGKAVRNGQLVMVEDGIFGLARSALERYQTLL